MTSDFRRYQQAKRFYERNCFLFENNAEYAHVAELYKRLEGGSTQDMVDFLVAMIRSRKQAEAHLGEWFE